MSNMFKAVTARSVKGYLAAVPPERREALRFLHGFIKRSAPSLKSHFADNMLGYGSFPYENHMGQTVRWPTVALADQKRYISIYVCALENGAYLAEKYGSKLGTVSVGKSCIRFKKVEDIDLPELKKLLQKAAKRPGLAGAAARKRER